MTTSAFTPSLLPLTSIRLGRLVLNRNDPHESYHDPPNTPEPLIKAQKGYDRLISSTNTLRLRTCLINLLSAQYKRSQTADIDLSATNAYTYFMPNSAKWFANACRDEGVREWLKEALEEDESVYLVVGYHTVVDAVVTMKTSRGGEYDGSVTDGQSLGGGVMVAEHGQERERWCAEGEQVYAVQYRKVGFRWFSSNVEKGTLRENRWRVYIHRGVENMKDSVEAGLEGEGECEGDGEGEGEIWIGEEGETLIVL